MNSIRYAFILPLVWLCSDLFSVFVYKCAVCVKRKNLRVPLSNKTLDDFLSIWCTQQFYVRLHVLTEITQILRCKVFSHLLHLHGQFCVVSLPYRDNEWSGSERDLLESAP